MKKLRIGIAFFYHESHSFSPLITTMDSFKNEGLFKGQEIIPVYQGTKTEVGGFLDVLLQDNEIEIVPLLCAAATPSGIVERQTYDLIEEQMLTSIKDAGRLDGLLLALHGAMVVDGLFDPEEKLLSEIRKILGSEIPIATTLDMHANLAETLLNHTPLHFGFKTYPHIDMFEQGVKAAETLLSLIAQEHQYYGHFKKLPMLPPSINMRTDEGPMKTLVDLAKDLEKESGICNVSVFGGFPYSDIPSAGASILVVSHNQQKGEEALSCMASRYWEIREEFIMELPDVKSGLEMARNAVEQKPVVLADISDNPLSGGSGDTTLLLREMLDANIPGSLFGGLFDYESICECQKAGIGNWVNLQLGGKVSPEFGEPVKTRAQVLGLSNGVFYNTGPMNHNLRVDLKGAAHIRIGEVDILLIGRPMSANDPQIFRHIGIEPTEKKILGLKVKNHFRAAFEPLVSQIIYVDAPGVASNRLDHFPYKNIKRPVWPLDREVVFEG